MRTRTNNVIVKAEVAAPAVSSNWSVSACNGDQSTGTSSVARPYIVLESKDSTIRDELGLRKPHGVVHRQKHLVINDVQTNLVRPNGAPFGLASFDANFRYDSLKLNADLTEDIANWSSSDLSGSLPPGWQITYPVHNPQVIINDLLERGSRQIADHALNVMESSQIYRPFSSAAVKLPRLRDNWNGIRAMYNDIKAVVERRKSVRQRDLRRGIASMVSNSYLAYKFGISPLLSDIKNSIDYIPSFARDVERIKQQTPSRFNRIVKGSSHYAETNNVLVSLNGYDVYQSSSNGFCTIQPTIRYVLVTKPTASLFGSLPAEFQSVMGRFGSSPANLAWERIPFSFVVDWFVDVRGLLRGIDDILGYRTFDVVSFTKSETWELNSQSRLKELNPCNGAVIYDSWCGQVRFKEYERSLVRASNSLASKPRFGKTQAAITAALIIQNLVQISPGGRKSIGFK